MTITIAQTPTPPNSHFADFTGLTEVTAHPGREALQTGGPGGSGTIVLGAPTITPHGSRAPLWWLWTAAGARPGVILGDAGVGKTQLLHGMLTATDGNLAIERWLLDYAGHSGELADQADQAAAGGVEVLDALQQLDAIATDRLVTLRTRRAPAPRGFLPTIPYRPDSAEPLLQVAIEDAGLLLSGDGHTARLATGILARLLENGPAAGIALTLVTQHIGPFLDDQRRRALLERAMTGNTVVLRTTLRSPSWIGLDWLPADPADVPAELPGAGYLAGHDGPFRAYLPTAGSETR